MANVQTKWRNVNAMNTYIFILFSILLSRTISAQPISHLSEAGIFDFAVIKSQEDFPRQYLTWLEQSNLESHLEIVNNCFGLTIPGINDVKPYTEVFNKKAFINDKRQSKTAMVAFSKKFIELNIGILNQWSDSIKFKSKFLFYALRTPGNNTIKLMLMECDPKAVNGISNVVVDVVSFSPFLKAADTYEGIPLRADSVYSISFLVPVSKINHANTFTIKTNVAPALYVVKLTELQNVRPGIKPNFQIDCWNGDVNACKLYKADYLKKREMNPKRAIDGPATDVASAAFDNLINLLETQSNFRYSQQFDAMKRMDKLIGLFHDMQ